MLYMNYSEHDSVIQFYICIYKVASDTASINYHSISQPIVATHLHMPPLSMF